MDELLDDPELPEMSEIPERAMRRVAVVLARAFLAGDSSPHGLRERGGIALGYPWPWLVPLSLRLHFDLGPLLQAAQHDAIVTAILEFPLFRTAFAIPGTTPRVRAYFRFHPPMDLPPKPLSGLKLPALATPGELADWLGITPAKLDWFSNAWSRPANEARLDHYHYRWIAKRSGDARLIEAPKDNLRTIQRRILHGILDRVPVHEAATGCVKGRSVLDNARLHAGAPMLLKMDLSDFFTSIPAGRIHALFRSLGYPAATARCLTGLTTHASPPVICSGKCRKRNTPAPKNAVDACNGRDNSGNPTCRKARRLRPRWPTCARTASIFAWPVSPANAVPATAATWTTWLFPAPTAIRHVAAVS